VKRNHFNCRIHDPYEHSIIKTKYPVEIDRFEDLNNLSVIIIAVGHDPYKKIGLDGFIKKSKQPAIIMDLSNIFVDEARAYEQLIYWGL
jgi:UDP-N-acetyl-D-mannosaminuronate dehydrogenase